MEIDAASRFEGAMKFDKAWSHHGEIGEHVVGAEEFSEGLHDVGDATGAFDDFLVHGERLHVPFPSIFEGFELGGGAGAVFFGEEDVVVLIAFERRVEIDEVDGFVSDVAAENVEVVAVIELIHVSGLYRKTRGMREVIGNELNNEYLARVKRAKGRRPCALFMSELKLRPPERHGRPRSVSLRSFVDSDSC